MMRHLVLGLLFCSATGWAEIKAQWDQSKDRPSLRINLAGSLTNQQKKLLYSGFSTFSHLEVRWLNNGARRSLVFISECTIKFDLWEEKFELLHFLERRKENSLQSFQQYTDLCLHADISSQSNIAQIASQGARLEVRLDISQVSNEFAQDVRSWLIQQQSGVMRGLFSHMLGDLKLSESTQTILVIPPLTSEAEKNKPVTKGAGRG
ncbi:hypothetical protein [Oligoflexus tunisiensis]|uniref:hypothetical protein n=1 Tax=Oligoflexus tunisiensis TaxID=708132 RepID=UPI00114C8C3C|nr:hypothetical protein [Oligoflexus tunisiensis]